MVCRSAPNKKIELRANQIDAVVINVSAQFFRGRQLLHIVDITIRKHLLGLLVEVARKSRQYTLCLFRC